MWSSYVKNITEYKIRAVILFLESNYNIAVKVILIGTKVNKRQDTTLCWCNSNVTYEILPRTIAIKIDWYNYNASRASEGAETVAVNLTNLIIFCIKYRALVNGKYKEMLFIV